MGLVYLPTFTIKKSTIHVGIYTIIPWMPMSTMSLVGKSPPLHGWVAWSLPVDVTVVRLEWSRWILWIIVAGPQKGGCLWLVGLVGWLVWLVCLVWLFLVVGFNPIEKIFVELDHFPTGRSLKKKTCLKPPTRYNQIYCEVSWYKEPHESASNVLLRASWSSFLITPFGLKSMYSTLESCLPLV